MRPDSWPVPSRRPSSDMRTAPDRRVPRPARRRRWPARACHRTPHPRRSAPPASPRRRRRWRPRAWRRSRRRYRVQGPYFPRPRWSRRSCAGNTRSELALHSHVRKLALPLANRPFHLEFDEVVHLDGVLERELFAHRLGEAVDRSSCAPLPRKGRGSSGRRPCRRRCGRWSPRGRCRRSCT